jgi:hypothetical protein
VGCEQLLSKLFFIIYPRSIRHKFNCFNVIIQMACYLNDPTSKNIFLLDNSRY